MALWELEQFAPPRFLGFIRELLPDLSFRGSEFLPDQQTDDVEFEYILGSSQRPVMATIVGWDTEAPMGSKRITGQRVQGEIPPIKRKERITEKEILRFLQPRAGTSDQQAAIAAVYDITARLVDGVLARKEWLQMQALSEDKVVYNEDGVIIQFDFGLDGKQQIDLVTQTNGEGTDVSAAYGPVWSDTANATPVSDLMQLQKDRREKGYAPYTRMVCSQKVLYYLYENAQIKAFAYDQNAPNRPLTLAEIQAVFSRYDIPVPTAYDATVDVEAANGTVSTVRTMAESKAFLLPSTNPGNTLIGPTAESRILVGTPYANLRSGIWANTYNQDEPPAEYVKVAATMFPTMPEARQIGQMKLIA
jgi:hypothetical protein